MFYYFNIYMEGFRGRGRVSLNLENVLFVNGGLSVFIRFFFLGVRRFIF